MKMNASIGNCRIIFFIFENVLFKIISLGKNSFNKTIFQLIQKEKNMHLQRLNIEKQRIDR
jgi:hypothetical protein